MLRNRVTHHINCQSCAVKNLCLPEPLSPDEIAYFNNFIVNIKEFTKGEHVFHTNDKMQNIYAIHKGSCKSYWLDENGNEHVDNFYFPGDLIGMESMPNRQHLLSLSVLEDHTQLCVIPLDNMFDMMQKVDKLLKRILHIASFKMQNDQHVRITTNAQQRIADFLLNILYRLRERQTGDLGSVSLPMSQVDISNFIGMAHETVNRVLKKMCQDNIIHIEDKKIYILDIAALETLGNPNRFFGQVDQSA